MAPNKRHVCGCCGKAGHTLATCSMPGAEKLRALKRKVRVLEETKPKSRAGQKATRRPKSFKKLAAQRSKQYSGKNKLEKDAARKRLASRKIRGRGEEGSKAAYTDLLKAGFLQKPPKRCPKCSRGVLGQEAQPYPGRRQDLLYVRCNEFGCQARHSVTSFSPIPKQILEKFSCSQLRSALEHYTDAAGRAAPRASIGARVAYRHRKPVEKLYALLRKTEARAAERENKVMQLGGEVDCIRNVEGDGTLLRKMNVGPKSKTWGAQIAQQTMLMKKRWDAKQKRQKSGARGVMKKLKKSRFVHPKQWTVHIRYAALAERGGRISVVKLPSRLVAPGSPPPPESFGEIKKAKLMHRLSKTAFLFCDGAHAWKKLVDDMNETRKSRVRLENVTHLKQEYTRPVRRPMRGQSTIAGTQSIDQRWRWMKVYVPHSLKGRCASGVNPSLDEYVFSWQWRSNQIQKCASLWDALGALLRNCRAS